jgi:hypothetical protein
VGGQKGERGLRATAVQFWERPPVDCVPFLYFHSDAVQCRACGVLVNAEVRGNIFDGGYVFGQHLRPMLAPFVDAGRVFKGTQLRLDGWRADSHIASV